MTLEIFAKAFFELCTPSVLLFLCLGVVIGTVIGALPGLSATMGIAIMTPITFWFPPANGFALLMGLWNAAIFSGGISAILINTPGTPASISQSLDGYQMYRQGKGGLALGVNVIYSFIGGVFSTLCLILFSTPIECVLMRVLRQSLQAIGMTKACRPCVVSSRERNGS